MPAMIFMMDCPTHKKVRFFEVSGCKRLKPEGEGFGRCFCSFRQMKMVVSTNKNGDFSSKALILGTEKGDSTITRFPRHRARFWLGYKHIFLILSPYKNKTGTADLFELPKWQMAYLTGPVSYVPLYTLYRWISWTIPIHRFCGSRISPICNLQRRSISTYSNQSLSGLPPTPQIPGGKMGW